MRTFLIILIFLISTTTKAQEVFINLNSNSVVKKEFKEKKIIKKNTIKGTTTVELPFFDDFSFSTVFPDNSLWQDSSVFINTSYGLNPPSVGIATFDAINKMGNLHENVIPNVTRLADTLTSQPINLNYPGDNTIFLSFFYQPQGEADAPQSTDTLVLEFYSPETKKWTSVWKAIYYQPDYVKEIFSSSEEIWQPGESLNKSFKNVIIPVLGSELLQNGFMFRFKNYVSIKGTIPSKIGNGDFWNIDYVLLDKDRDQNDVIMPDVAFIQPTTSLLADYEAIPWRHYVSSPSSVKKNEFMKINYRNNDKVTRTIDSLYITFRDTLKHTPTSKLEASASNIVAFAEMNPELPLGAYSYPTHSDKKAVFEIKVKLVTSSTSDPVENNQTKYYQNFYNYYAYDDGVAELGYGISGSGTKNAMVAYQFTNYISDTIRSVDMYFNRTFDDESQRYFDLTIWNDNNGKPGEIIYQEIGHRPEYNNEIGQFYNYPIADTTDLVLSGIYYIGWTQTYEALLNIGYDINRDAQDKIFYNIDGGWQNSSRAGALLIRPVFRKELLTSIKEPNVIGNDDIVIYPNPASDNLKVKISTVTNEEVSIHLFDYTGKKVLSIEDYYSENDINITNLFEGIYIMQIRTQKSVISKKIVVRK